MRLLESSKQFLCYCENIKKLSGHTLRAYEIDLDSFTSFVGQDCHIDDINRATLKKYLQHLYDHCGLKQSSAKRRFACIKTMFRWLECEELIHESPFRKLNHSIRLPNRLPRGLNVEELKALLNSPLFQLGTINHDSLSVVCDEWMKNRAYRFRQLVTLTSLHLLFATGIRVAELSSIEVSDLDLSESKIRIHGKGDRERLVFLTGSSLHKLLRTYLAIRDKIATDHNHLMITPRGNKANTQYIRLLVLEAGKTAKLNRRITPHMLRHSTATHLLNNGVDIRFVQRLLGHQSITTTQIYTQVGDTMLKEILLAKHPMEAIMSS